MKTIWKIGLFEGEPHVLIIVTILVLFALGVAWTAAERTWGQKPVVVKSFRPVRGVVGLKGPVAIQEQDAAGQTRAVKVEKQEISVKIKDNKGKIVSEKQIESKAKGRGK